MRDFEAYLVHSQAKMFIQLLSQSLRVFEDIKIACMEQIHCNYQFSTSGCIAFTDNQPRETTNFSKQIFQGESEHSILYCHWGLFFKVHYDAHYSVLCIQTSFVYSHSLNISKLLISEQTYSTRLENKCKVPIPTF